MKIYFSAAIGHRDKLLKEYKSIKRLITDLGHEYIESFDVLKEDLGMVLAQTKEDSSKYIRHWKKTISSVDMAVLEGTYPGTINLGFEASSLVERGKPVVLLHKKGLNPTFLSDFHSKRIIKLEYTNKNLKEVLEYGIDEAKEMLDRRFTMIINPEIDDHLSVVSKNSDMSKSDYIRELITKDMKK